MPRIVFNTWDSSYKRLLAPAPPPTGANVAHQPPLRTPENVGAMVDQHDT